MRPARIVALVVIGVVTACCVCAAAERHWQTGTWIDVGLAHDPFIIGGSSSSGPAGFGTATPTRPGMTEVGRYIIETPDLRIELHDIVPIGSRESFDATVTVGASVTFALEKNVAYIRNADGTEHRLRVVKKVPRPKPEQ
jgi:hypothetical protein